MLKQRLHSLIRHPRKLITKPLLKVFGRIMPDPMFISIQYFQAFGKFPDLKNPRTFNEKLQWLKLHNRKPEYTIMVDKVEAKKWVAEKIGEEYIIPTLGVWEKAEDIDFDKLPDQFVLKTNHDSGCVVICKDKSKLDVEATKKILRKSLKRNYYMYGREWPYKNVKRRIFAETYLSPDNRTDSTEIVDYKFMCFNGKVGSIFLCSDRHSKEGLNITIFDENWNLLPVKRPTHSTESDYPKPITFDLMTELAQNLSRGHKFLRVDLFEKDNKVYFGELTFFPGSGYEEFEPTEWDKIFGDKITV